MQLKGFKYSSVKSHLVYVIILIAVLFAHVVLYKKYILYSNVVSNTKAISYILKDTKIHSGGRGNHYSGNVYYNKKIYYIDLTSKMKYYLDHNKPLILYYCAENDSVISTWDITLQFRLLLLNTLFGVVTLLLYLKNIVKTNRGNQ
jgi:hypothetical protein